MSFSVQISGYEGSAMEPFLSRDGQILFFNNKNDGTENCDLWWATATSDPARFIFQGSVSADTVALEGVASMDFAGNFFFITNRKPPNTIYQGKWKGPGNVSPVSPIKGVSFTAPEFGMDAEISADGQTLYYAPAVGSQAIPQAHITMAKRNWDGSFQPATQDMFTLVNLGGSTYAPCTTPDELTLFLTKYDPALYQGPQLYFATRASKSQSFGAPTHIPEGSAFVEGATIRSDGAFLYFHRLTQTGTFEIALLPLS